MDRESLVIWGGFDGTYLDDGARYFPQDDSWISLPTANAPSPRGGHTALWTGSELLVWGGWGNDDPASGARYRPGDNRWFPISTQGAPSDRGRHTAVWTGEEMIVWGGWSGAESRKDGAAYNPVTDRWRSISAAPIAQRGAHSAVWTGEEMIIFGGQHGNTVYDDGAIYIPSTDSWIAIEADLAIGKRSQHEATFANGVMSLWGGDVQSGVPSRVERYDLGNRRWMEALPGLHALSVDASANSSEQQLVLWGGGEEQQVQGAALTLGVSTWQAIEPAGAPDMRTQHSLVAEEHVFFIWGGQRGDGGYLQSGAFYVGEQP